MPMMYKKQLCLRITQKKKKGQNVSYLFAKTFCLILLSITNEISSELAWRLAKSANLPVARDIGQIMGRLPDG